MKPSHLASPTTLLLPPWLSANSQRDVPRCWTLQFISAGPDQTLGRYSYLLSNPRAKLVWHRGQGHFGDGNWQTMTDPWAILKQWLADHRRTSFPDAPPFHGGIAGLFGYGLTHHLERINPPKHDEFTIPDLAVGLFEEVDVHDRVTGRTWRYGTRSADTYPPFPSADRPVTPAAECLRPLPAFPNLYSNFSRTGFLGAVQRAVDYIHAGDCFQVNLAQRLLTPARNPVTLFESLVRHSPAPFSGLFLADDFAIVSSSPERFLRMDAAGRIETRPIKGTRPRQQPVEADAAAAQELLDSMKDRAENIMIVDLLRNDLGKVCEYGTIQVESACNLESYSQVHHLVSVVTGQLRPRFDAIDLLKASFPGGSVTGAPKVRAMEIISELEPTARGPYCGCLGWIGFDGAMDTNILIRTFTWKGGWLQFPVGGGIVADSEPAAEYEETLHKAAGMLKALA